MKGRCSVGSSVVASEVRQGLATSLDERDHAGVRLVDLIGRRRLAWYALARRMLDDAHAAEDCVQEALAVAWVHRADVRDERALEAWVRRILVRAVGARRRKRTDLPISSSSAAPTAVEDDVLDRWTLRQAIAMIEALPARQRTAVLDRLLDDRPYASIAVRMGCHEATARSLVRCGLERVRPELRTLVD